MKRAASQRRQDLLEASIDYILEKGVANLSLRPLAAQVGSKARLLIYHFHSKDSLVANAMIVVRDRVQKAFATVVKRDKKSTAPEIVRAFWLWATASQHERSLRL
jgi:AcrR family transcriptional regulator